MAFEGPLAAAHRSDPAARAVAESARNSDTGPSAARTAGNKAAAAPDSSNWHCWSPDIADTPAGVGSGGCHDT